MTTHNATGDADTIKDDDIAYDLVSFLTFHILLPAATHQGFMNVLTLSRDAAQFVWTLSIQLWIKTYITTDPLLITTGFHS